jgi:hypothetical protein
LAIRNALADVQRSVCPGSYSDLGEAMTRTTWELLMLVVASVFIWQVVVPIVQFLH